MTQQTHILPACQGLALASRHTSDSILYTILMKAGTVALIGRPNVGKSTLVNTIVGQKVAITSPKPQTTRFPIQALYQDERGQIIFIDTPGVFKKAKDAVSKKINRSVLTSLEGEFDVLLYIVDPTRKREYEEGRVLGLVRKVQKPKVLVFNKSDVENSKYLPQYEFLRDEFEDVFIVSGLKQKHLKPLLDKLFELLPERSEIIKEGEYIYPALNLDSKTFISEIIREKVFLRTRQELPYTTTVVVDEVAERKDGTLYVKARILTTDLVYKKMLIGVGGRAIKIIGSMARKELELSRNKKVYLDLTVEVDKHWISTLG